MVEDDLDLIDQGRENLRRNAYSSVGTSSPRFLCRFTTKACRGCPRGVPRVSSDPNVHCQPTQFASESNRRRGGNNILFFAVSYFFSIVSKMFFVLFWDVLLLTWRTITCSFRVFPWLRQIPLLNQLGEMDLQMIHTDVTHLHPYTHNTNRGELFFTKSFCAWLWCCSCATGGEENCFSDHSWVR